MTTAPNRLGCVENAAVYQDPSMETPPGSGAPVAERRRATELRDRAATICGACPVLQACLYRAVVVYDVAGYVAGTTQKQRAEIRRRLSITVEPEDFDTLAGVTGGHRQVDHDEVVRLRRANPDESLERLAGRLGCSLSTVKRHLRRERNTPSADDLCPNRRPAPAAVWAVAIDLVGDHGRSGRPLAA